MSKGSLTVVCGLALLVPAFSYGAAVVDVYDGLGTDFAPLDTFFTGFGYTVDQITSSFTASSIAGANFVIISEPLFTPSAAQISALDAYVTGGGRLLINSEWYPGFATEITNTNLILTGLGSSIVNLDTASNGGFYDTSDIVANPFTAGVSDINYAATSSLSVGAPGVRPWSTEIPSPMMDSCSSPISRLAQAMFS